ncbi:MAG TPA: hypothetical protein VF543_22590 [Pyrinomonadaceae bacterium]|jgi:hypothetical protein
MSGNSPENDKDTTQIRVKKDVFKYLEAEAKAENRSATKQIDSILRDRYKMKMLPSFNENEVREQLAKGEEDRIEPNEPQEGRRVNGNDK